MKFENNLSILENDFNGKNIVNGFTLNNLSIVEISLYDQAIIFLSEDYYHNNYKLLRKFLNKKIFNWIDANIDSSNKLNGCYPNLIDGQLTVKVDNNDNNLYYRYAIDGVKPGFINDIIYYLNNNNILNLNIIGY